MIRTQKFSTSYDNMQGSFSFNGSRSGNAFADFLLGEAFNYTENEIEEKGYFFATDYEFYAQDDWKAGRDLTINYGLRYYVMEGGNGGAEKYDRISTFVPGLYDPAQAPRLTAAGDLVAGTGDPMNGLITPTNLKGLDLPRSLKKTHFDVFGPRLGFAYSLPGGRATVLRGGYGLFYFWGENNNEGRQSNPPFGRSANIFTTRLSNPGAGTDRIFPPNVAAVDVENLPPTIMHWSLGVQRELGAGLLAEVTYVGTRSYHLIPRAEHQSAARRSGSLERWRQYQHHPALPRLRQPQLLGKLGRVEVPRPGGARAAPLQRRDAVSSRVYLLEGAGRRGGAGHLRQALGLGALQPGPHPHADA